jgi:hypothetical protein
MRIFCQVILFLYLSPSFLGAQYAPLWEVLDSGGQENQAGSYLLYDAFGQGGEPTSTTNYLLYHGWIYGLEEEKTTGGIRGQVLKRSNQEPLVGAEVEVKETGDKTTTDQTGLYQFTGLSAGTYTLQARAPHYKESAEKQVEVNVGQIAALNFELVGEPAKITYHHQSKTRAVVKEADISLSVKVIDIDNFPCPEVKVEFRLIEYSTGAFLEETLPETNSEGIATTFLTIGKEVEEHVVQAIENSLEGSPVEFKIQVLPGALAEITFIGPTIGKVGKEIEMKVLAKDDEENLIPGQEINLSLECSQDDTYLTTGTGGERQGRSITVTTGQDGEAEFKIKLSQTPEIVHLIKANWGDISGEWEIKSKPEVGIIKGVVKRAYDRTPINPEKEPKIKTVDQDENVNWFDVSADGRYEIFLESGEYEIIATAQGYKEQKQTVTLQINQTIELEPFFLPAQPEEIVKINDQQEVEVKTEVEVKIKVQNKEGIPCAGEKVKFTIETSPGEDCFFGGRPGVKELEKTTNQEGSFDESVKLTLSQKAGETKVKIEVKEGEGVVLEETFIVIGVPGPASQLIEVKRTYLAAVNSFVDLKVKVADEYGNGIKGEEVDFSIVYSPYNEGEIISVLPSDSFGLAVARFRAGPTPTVTEDQTTYIIVRASKDNCSPSYLDLNVGTMRNVGWILGRVFKNNQRNKVVPGVRVEVFQGQNRIVEEVTDENGDFRLTVAPNTYDLKFSKENFKPNETFQNQEVAIGQELELEVFLDSLPKYLMVTEGEEVKIPIGASQKLETLLTDHDRDPLPGFKIKYEILTSPDQQSYLNEENQREVETRTDEEGKSQVVLYTTLKKGEYSILCSVVEEQIELKKLLKIETTSPVPKVKAVWPKSGAVEVPVTTEIKVFFNIKMNPRTFDGNVTIQEKENGVKQNLIFTPPLLEVERDGKKFYLARFRPQTRLSYLTSYQVEVHRRIESVAGDSMKSSKKWEFTTENLITSTFPEADQRNVSVKTVIKIFFKEAVEINSFSGKIEVKETGAKNIFEKVILTDEQKTAIITLKHGLNFQKTYQVLIKQGIKTLSGFLLGKDFSWEFETEKLPEIKEPYVTNYPNPAKGVNKTTFCYYLPHPAEVVIDIYTVDYKFVQQLKGYCQDGYGEILWDLSSIPSGVYLYFTTIKYNNGEKKEVRKKVVVIK